MKKITKTFFSDCKNLLDESFNNIKKIPWIFSKDAFLFIMIFVLLGILFGEFLFYKYVILTEIKSFEVVDVSTKFRKKEYQSVLEKLQSKEDIFKNSLQGNYSDPFR